MHLASHCAFIFTLPLLFVLKMACGQNYIEVKLLLESVSKFAK